MKLVSIVVSMYNEESGIAFFSKNLVAELKKLDEYNFEILWVNDGSLDHTQQKIEKSCDSNNQNVKHVFIQFSRNFGHEAAMLAGVDNARGEAVICLDADGQHPPAEIRDMLKAFENGHEIVLMQRVDREDHGLIKSSLSRMFYTLINKLSVVKFQKNASDFFLISDNIAQILKQGFRDNNRFLRGFIQELGFNVSVLEYNAPKREFGESNYSFYKLLKLAFNVIFAFSNKPLRIVILISILFFLFTIAFGGYSLVQYFVADSIPSGYTSIIFFISLSFSLMFLVLTILSIYFEKTIKEIKRRPIYIVREIKRLD
ncbi:glycosyltransferase family 2 protein [Draconibacterium sp. IB214405]|uniref:glycosyltransferase family 2 protein n=1 Tax=Draconibacterium sp. IB214405 TaxID=3097352 RepID=UPI002A0C87C9|nr:glycosyltransferase family 2 protein [Draconibacterium sp. IB214405]MDX8340508.1 glycosyltransferase family 2 protein [Draconibacterium sp. IB214405]